MSLVKPLVFENGFNRPVANGDVEAWGEVIGTLGTVGAGVLTAALITGYSILSRSGPVGAYADTTDTAANIIASVAVNGQTPMQGTTFRQRILNTVAFICTYTAGTGVTLAGVTAIAASSYRDYLITLTNTTPVSIASAATTNASAIVTGMDAAETALVSPGQLVTGTGIQAGSTVLSVQPGIGVTLSLAATATAGIVALTFSPTVTVTGIGGGLI